MPNSGRIDANKSIQCRESRSCQYLVCLLSRIEIASILKIQSTCAFLSFQPFLFYFYNHEKNYKQNVYHFMCFAWYLWVHTDIDAVHWMRLNEESVEIWEKSRSDKAATNTHIAFTSIQNKSDQSRLFLTLGTDSLHRRYCAPH